MSATERLLTARMTRERRAELQAYFDRNIPSPRWVESILTSFEANTSAENVLKVIRNDPSQTLRYCTNLSVGLYFQRMGLGVEFLDTEESRNFDLVVGGRVAVEVKLLDDISNWSLLSSRVLQVPSSYMVWIETDLELSPGQIDTLVDGIYRETASRTEPSFRAEVFGTNLSFFRVQTRRTLPVLSSRTFGVNLRDLRRLFLTRINDSGRQLERSQLVKLVAIDVQRSAFFRSTSDAVFCGSVGTRFAAPSMTPLFNFRNSGGLLAMEGFWNGLDAVMVFYGYVQDSLRRVAYYTRPTLAPDAVPTRFGTPDNCDDPTYLD